jgi:N,N'-diacetyllegionaminate synthase
MKTLVIAEAGVNHNGDLAIAKELIAAAADAGADWIKFQTFFASNIVSSYAPKAEYQKVSTDTQESQLEMLRKLELTTYQHHELINECKKRDICFFSSAFDRESISLLNALGGADIFKIPSGELTNLPYLRDIGRHGKQVLLSTGMSNLGEIEAAINVLEKGGTPRSKITVLQCTTEYPTPMEEVNLLAMVSIGKAFGVTVGYSDHTPGIEVPIAAVALGAQVIEKHLTLNRNLPGPDHRASLEPAEFKAMVNGIRNIEKALGDGIKRPGAGESKNKLVARKSIVAACTIKAGETFNEENLVAKRPGTGISPMRWDDVIGRIATRDFRKDEIIEL